MIKVSKTKVFVGFWCVGLVALLGLTLVHLNEYQNVKYRYKAQLEAQSATHASAERVRLLHQLQMFQAITNLIAEKVELKQLLSERASLEAVSKDIDTHLTNLDGRLERIINADKSTVTDAVSEIPLASEQSLFNDVLVNGSGFVFSVLDNRLVVHIGAVIQHQAKVVGAVQLRFVMGEETGEQYPLSYVLLPDNEVVNLYDSADDTNRLDFQGQTAASIDAQDMVVREQKSHGFDYFSLSSRADKQYQLDQVALTGTDLQLAIFTDASHLFESFDEEVIEGLVNLLLMLLLLGFVHRLLSYYFQVRELTYTDALTGLYNRKHMDDFLPDFMQMHNRKRITALGILLVDIDHFKSVNDTYGHAMGDKVLAALADMMRKNSRDSDLLYRFGGEEFFILCPGDNVEGLMVLAERLRAAAEQIESIQDVMPSGITISIGVAERIAGETSEQLFERADKLLYQAKRKGRNRIEHLYEAPPSSN